MPDYDIKVNDDLSIPRSEIETRATRSSGAGGQHVNKTASRIEITWNIRTSRSLSDDQRDRLLAKLESRLSEEGVIRIVASDTRSQLRNREHAEKRLAELIARSLTIRKRRKPTRRPRAANEARLTEKKKNSEKKRDRRVAE